MTRYATHMLLVLLTCLPLAVINSHYCGDLTVGDALGIEPPAIAAPIAADTIPTIAGPAETPAGKPAWYAVTGISGTASAAFLPTALLDTDPSRVVAGNALFWVAEPGTYVLTAIVVDWDARRFTPLSKQITVAGEVPPVPPPDPDPQPNPYPSPPANWQAAVKPILATHPTQAYAQAKAATFARLAKAVRAESALRSTADLYQLLAGESSDGDSDPAVRAAVASVIQQALGRKPVPLDREEAAAMLEAIAWALWEAGK